MASVDFITKLHTGIKRDYLERVLKHDKADCTQVAKEFGKDYWDGEHKYGYGGYYYDGRWKAVAQDMVKYYGLETGGQVLDVGCGKGFLLYDIKSLFPQIEVRGIDISGYAIEHSKEEVRLFLDLGTACELPYPDNYFDLVISINTLHSLYIYELEKALKEIKRVSKENAYIVVESYRNEKEKANLLHWQLTCECFYTPEEWEWFFKNCGYTGNYSFIFFE